MSGFRKLIHEVHRRSLWQVIGIYLGACWIALQVVEILTESVGLPDWVQPFAIVLLVIGFPIVLATAFVQEGMGSKEADRASPRATEPEPPPFDLSATEASSVVPATEEAPRVSAVAGAAEPGAHHRLFTWRNALLGGVAAFALLGVATAGWMTMRTMGIGPAATLVAKGAIDERAIIILADFESSDSLLSRAATEAFRVDLSQSPVVRLADPSFVNQALRRMERSADASLNAELGREIAQREGVGAVIAGEINPAGTGFVLTAQVLAPADGTVLASHRETAADSTQILSALDQLSRKLRERIGESYTSMQGDEPLERATTANLEALRLYSQAVEAAETRGDPDRGIALLEEAVALDTAFAMAWRKLGVVLANRQQQRARAVEALTKAYEHRDRLTKRERYFATGSYFQQATNEPERAIPAYENLLELDPADHWALNNLAVEYGRLRDFPRAEALLERAIAADSTDAALSLSNLHGNLIAQGRWEDAEATLDRHRRLFPDDAFADANAAAAASARGDYDSARELEEKLRAEHPGNLWWRSSTSSWLARFAAAQGKLAEAESHRADSEAVAVQRDLPWEALDEALDPVWYDVRVREDPARAAARLREALEKYRLQEMPALDRPYTQLVSLSAFTGQPGRARELLAEFEREVPPELRFESSYRRAVGSIALAEGAYEDAIEEFRRSDEGLCRLCPLPGLAQAYDAAGQADSAIAVYERYLNTPARGRSIGDATELGRTLERLGELYDAAGNWEKAAEYYARFVELWKDADPELQSRVEAAQARLDEIFAERG